MSLHYEWMLSLWLRPDTPADYLDELRYHLGMTDETPGALELGDLGVLSGGGDDYLPGGTVATLKLAQPYTNRPAAWGLHVRTFVLDTRCTNCSPSCHRGSPAGRRLMAGSASPARR
jgi:hypothetical protein